ncbi:uncharacterized protein LOC112230566 [Oncorhynchus tshawytscha]|uniref:uncharacterized protein LOC112230566 n=1 Tax=Oncorhynchus tshawytscha TaxID=74940 RepID=UPI000D0A4699|nr:uncharacterized protein LOC112230566 [Oncorhynchus tshawytscha]
MRVSRVLQLSICLVGLSLAWCSPPPGKPSIEGGGQVPVGQIQVLSVGLLQLLQGVRESAWRMERQGDQVSEELMGDTQVVERLREQGVQVGRTHRQVTKNLQMMTAQSDRLENAAQDMQLGLETLLAEQGALELRMCRVLERVQSITKPVLRMEKQLNMNLMKVIVDTQSRRLADLALEVMTRDRLIDKHLQHIVDLEEQASRIRGERPPTSAEGRF